MGSLYSLSHQLCLRCHTLRTSDYEFDVFHIVRIVWILHGVNPLVFLADLFYDQVRLVEVEFGAVVDHVAAAHQDHVVPPVRVVLERHLELGGGQRDVEILPEEQSALFIICAMEQQKDDGMNLGQNL